MSPDGKADNQTTETALQSGLAETSLYKAFSYRGTKEQGTNTSPVIDQFIKRGGGRPGLPWCMYFVYYCVDEASKFLNKDNPLYRTGRVWEQLNRAYYSNLSRVFILEDCPNFKFEKGDILIMKHGGLKRSEINKIWNGHTGFNIKQIDSRTLETIEGNTNKAGSREGDGVWQKARKIRGNMNIVAVIRIS